MEMVTIPVMDPQNPTAVVDMSLGCAGRAGTIPTSTKLINDMK